MLKNNTASHKSGFLSAP